MAGGSTGSGLRMHTIFVKAGEDVSSKIISFVQNSPTDVTILSAIGALSNVTLCISPGGKTVTYEGEFTLLRLSGSFMRVEIDGQWRRAGSIMATLAAPGGRVIGGLVTSVLIAASPVEVTLLIEHDPKEPKSANNIEASHAPLNGNLGGMTGANSSPSSGSYSDSASGSCGGSPSGFDGESSA